MSRATTSITVACVMAAAVTLSARSTSTTPSAPPSQSTNPSTASAADAATTNPYAKLPAVPRLAVTSTSVHDGQQFATPQLSGLFGSRTARTSRPN